MKHIKKFLSLLLVLTMVLAMSSGVFAKEASSGKVKVSITYNMFTKGGLDAAGKPADQAYQGGTPTMANVNANYYILNYEMSIEDIQELIVDSGVRDTIYNPPAGLQTNVLDAIIAAFYYHDIYDIKGGWDPKPTATCSAGGYIHDVEGQNIVTNTTRQETVNGIKYDVYSGTGWNIACTQKGEISALKCYGTNYGLVDGMEIVFDVSPYELYEPAA